MPEPGIVRKSQIVCPAGSLRALRLAVDAGADAVYRGLKYTLDAIGTLAPFGAPPRPR